MSAAVEMKKGARYNWKGQSDRLVYIGRKGAWHQFEKVDEPGRVWCEVLTEDLHHLEETQPQQEAPTTDDVRELSKWLNEEVAAPINRQALARVLASVQQPQQRGELPSEVQIEAGARAICKRHAAHWNNTPDEDWAAYSYDHRADAKACLVAALAALQKGG